MLRKFPVCANNKARATLCDPALRTVNTNVSCGAPDDWYVTLLPFVKSDVIVNNALC
jgi:hypothetical protein